MIKRLGICSLCVAAASLPFAANADTLFDKEVGVYGGVGIGYGTFENEDFLTEDNDLRDDRMTWQAYLGGRVTPYIGLEAAYVDFGEADGDGGFLDANGVSAALGVHWPLADTVTLSARVGQLWWDATGTGVAPLDEFDFDIDGNDPFYGVGAHFGQSEGLGIAVRYDLFELDDTDIEVPSLNLEFGF